MSEPADKLPHPLVVELFSTVDADECGEIFRGIADVVQGHHGAVVTLALAYVQSLCLNQGGPALDDFLEAYPELMRLIRDVNMEVPP